MSEESTDKQTAENGQAQDNAVVEARDGAGRYAPGNAGGPGRPAGTPNKINALLKDDILDAYAVRGGQGWLRGLPDPLFVRLLEKTMPREIAADIRRLDAPKPLSVCVRVDGDDSDWVEQVSQEADAPGWTLDDQGRFKLACIASDHERTASRARGLLARLQTGGLIPATVEDGTPTE